MEENKNIEFSADALALAKKIMARYPEGKHKSAILPILHIAQAEFGGFQLPLAVLALLSALTAVITMENIHGSELGLPMI